MTVRFLPLDAEDYTQIRKIYGGNLTLAVVSTICLVPLFGYINHYHGNFTTVTQEVIEFLMLLSAGIFITYLVARDYWQ